MATLEERVTGIEAQLPYLASKADIAGLETKLADLKNDLAWRLIGIVAIASSIIIGVIKLWN